jgi:hypothetical protein
MVAESHPSGPRLFAAIRRCQRRLSIVAPAQRSTAAKLKAFTKQAVDGARSTAFKLWSTAGDDRQKQDSTRGQKHRRFEMLTQSTAVHQRALDLLGVSFGYTRSSRLFD